MLRTAQRFFKRPDKLFHKSPTFLPLKNQNIAFLYQSQFYISRMMFSSNNNNDDNKNDDDHSDEKIVDTINQNQLQQEAYFPQDYSSAQQLEFDGVSLQNGQKEKKNRQRKVLNLWQTKFKDDKENKKQFEILSRLKNSDGSFTVPIVPMLDHPIVQSFPVMMAITKDLYYVNFKFLANNLTHVVTSIVQNPDIAFENIDPKIPSVYSTTQVMVNINNKLYRRVYWPKLPKVTKLQDIYDIGLFCEIQFGRNEDQKDKNKPPYYISLQSISKAKILQVYPPPPKSTKQKKNNPKEKKNNQKQKVQQQKQQSIQQQSIQQQKTTQDPVKKEPRKRGLKKEYPLNLSIVRALRIIQNRELTSQDLDMEQEVNYKFLQSFYQRASALLIARNNYFSNNNIQMQLPFNKVHHFLDYLFLFIMRSNAATFNRFPLKKIQTHQAQLIFQEPVLGKKIQLLLNALSQQYSRMVVWQNLQNHVHTNHQYRQAYQKQAEIYEMLKQKFTGEQDDRKIQEKKFRKNLEGKTVPQHIQKIIDEEIERFLSMDKNMSQSQVTKTYLEILTSLPFGITTEENFEIKKAQQILDQGHYGMDDVKQRILEFIAVAKLKGSVHGKILCFVGPPGVGKTSIGESIAKAINRKFARIAVGGDQDTHVLKGFRKTYIGSEPGKIIKALRNSQSENPVIMIDEIDKLGMRSVHGDPSSVLLQILDPQQNHSFTDNYLDTSVDLSKVLFLCTANMLDTIPGPLLDRMDVITVSGYTQEEKTHILEKYLKPRAIEKSGLDSVQNKVKFEVTDEAVSKLIKDYCRQPGVRSLQRYINRIMEKIALKVVEKMGNDVQVKEQDEKKQDVQVKKQDGKVEEQNKQKSQEVKEQEKTEEIKKQEPQQKETEVQPQQTITVEKQNLDQYIGNPKFSSKKIYQKTPVGVVIGLAYNQYGGSILYIESSQSSGFLKNSDEKVDKVGSIKLTGRLGEVMSESSSLAYSFAKRFIASNLSQKQQAQNFIEKADIHLHFPQGAVPKDGPSAGISITSSLISLALNQPIKQGIGMTGEITLNGKVLPIGGVKEKAMAAIREGIFTLIFPRQNEKDVAKLPDFITKDLTIHYVDEYKDVFDILFTDSK